MISFLRRIASLCQDHPRIRDNIIGQNVIATLLHRLAESTDAQLQSAILHFLSILFRYRADRQEVKKFFGIFWQNVGHVGQFMDALLNVVDDGCAQNVRPSFFLTFPAPQGNGPTAPNDRSRSDEWIRSMQAIPQNSHFPSPWTRSCAILSAARQPADEHIWSTGFSASFWLKCANGERTHTPTTRPRMAENGWSGEVTHVLSLGSDSTLLQVWIDEQRRCFVIRLTAVDHSRKNAKLLLHATTHTISRDVDLARWNLMALSVSLPTQSEPTNLQIKVIIGGAHEQRFEAQLRSERLATRTNEPITVLIGDHVVDAGSNFHSRYNFGNFMLFRSDILNKAFCMAIRGHGPDLENFLAFPAEAAQSNRRCSSAFIDSDAAAVGADNFDLSHEKCAQLLQKQALISFAPRAAHHFYRYLPVGKRCTTKEPEHASHKRVTECQTTDKRCVKKVQILWLHSVLQQRVATFDDYIVDVGGLSFVAYLLAKVVDRSNCPVIHAKALKFVLKICNSNWNLRRQLASARGYHLISCIIASRRFQPSQMAFVALLEAVCDQQFAETDVCALRWPCNATIRQPTVIETLILPHCGRWHTCDARLMCVFFKCLCQSIGPQSAHQSINGRVLASHGIVEDVLNVFRQTFQTKDNGSDSSCCCCDQNLHSAILEFLESIISLLQCVDHIKQIAEFLLATHPSSAAIPHPKPLTQQYFWLLEDSLKEKSQPQPEVTRAEHIDRMTSEFLMKYEDGCDSQYYTELVFLQLADADEGGTADFDNIDDWGIVEDDSMSEATDFCAQCQSYFDDCLPAKCASQPSCKDSRAFFVCGLLNVLHNTILVLSDTKSKTVCRDIINGHFLLTLANHWHSSVREAVVRVVNSLVIHFSTREANVLDEIPQGFHVLADQLSLHPVTEELVNCCISLILQHDFLSYPDKDVQVPLHLFALPPLLALLPKSVPNFPAAIRIIRFIKFLIKKAPHALKKLNEHGLVDSLLKTIQIIIHTGICELCQQKCANPLLIEIMDLFVAIIRTCLQNSTNFSNPQIFHEILYKWHWLTIIEDSDRHSDGQYLRIMCNLRYRIIQTASSVMFSSIKPFRTKYKDAVRTSGENELCSHSKFIVDRVMEYILFAPFVTDLNGKNFHLICQLFVFLINAVSNTIENSGSFYYRLEVPLKRQTVKLLLWMLSPSKSIFIRLFPVRKLFYEAKMKEILITLFHKDVDTEEKFCVFLWQLTYSNIHKLSKSEEILCKNFIQRLQHSQVLSTRVTDKIRLRWFFEVRSQMREMTVKFWKWEKSYFAALITFVKKYVDDAQAFSDAKFKSGCILSANILRRLDTQNKNYLLGDSERNCTRVEMKMNWKKIIRQLTHERAPCFARFKPEFGFWDTNFSPGADEIEKRLRCESNAAKKFRIRKCLGEMEYGCEKDLPYLFEQDDSNDSIIAYIFNEDTISHVFNVVIVLPGVQIDGEILVGEKGVYLIAAQNTRYVEFDNEYIIRFNTIDEVLYRTYKSKECGLEMFMSNGGANFFLFLSREKRDEFVDVLKKYISSNRIICGCILDVFVRKWRNGLITNWEYLTTLNKLAGKSYNDIMQYPIMPAILIDYNSEIINLDDPNIYRNLKKLAVVENINEERKINRSYSSNQSNIFEQTQNMLSDTASNNYSTLAEYFRVSEILFNLYTFKRNNNGKIKSIKLPSWADNNYRLLALVYRQLLESHHARENLSNWIDVKFGYKRTNKQAVDLTNYQDFSQSSKVENYQIGCPILKQLFSSPHPRAIGSINSQSDACRNIPVIPGVRGIKWGNFVGSPSQNPPSVISKKYFSLTVVALVPLLTNSVYVVFPKTAPLFFHDYEQVIQMGDKENIREFHSSSLYYWNSEDGVISISENHIRRPIAFCPPRDPITVCSTTPHYSCIWVGLTSGNILVFRLLFDDSFKFTNVDPDPSVLIGHSDKINGIHLSRPFGIAVSISDDQLAIVWDLNKMVYIAYIAGIDLPLDKVTVSDTLGDIATVGHNKLKGSSLLRVHTIDAISIGAICTEEKITAVCFSTAPEGISVNVVAAAFQNGVIRLWNTWNFSPVAEFGISPSSPIISLTYSFDSHNLYASTGDGYVVVWRNSEKNQAAQENGHPT